VNGVNVVGDRDRRGESGRRFEPAVMDTSLRTGDLPVHRAETADLGKVTHQDGRRTVRRAAPADVVEEEIIEER